ncbi:hypothetical protein Hanom_Chr02g00177671 [Helianthus anomalus]
MDMVTNPAKLAGGISKLPIFLSKVVPCFTKRVLICAIIVLGTNVAIKMGNIRSICLVSSTSVTVHNIHEGAPSVLTQALFKNLYKPILTNV